jgi:ATP-dependent Lon protease
MADQHEQVSLDAIDELITRFDKTADEIKEALDRCQIALTREREKTTALRADKEQAVASEAQLRQELEQTEQKNHDLAEQDSELRDGLEEQREENEVLQRELNETCQNVEDLQASLDQARTAEAKSQQVLGETKNRNQDLESQLTQLHADLEEQHEALTHVQQAHDTLQEELEAAEHEITNLKLDKQIIAQERDKAENKIEEIKTEYQWDLVKALSPVLTKLSALADLEPEPVRGLTPRSVFEKLKQWIGEATGERLKAFPAPKEASNGLLLDPDQEGWEALIARYDWSPERPFEGLPEGERSREFRVLQRGWQANDRILIRARVTPVKAPDEGR